MLATSKNVLFPGHNHLLTTHIDNLTLWLSPERQCLEAYSRNTDIDKYPNASIEGMEEFAQSISLYSLCLPVYRENQMLQRRISAELFHKDWSTLLRMNYNYNVCRPQLLSIILILNERSRRFISIDQIDSVWLPVHRKKCICIYVQNCFIRIAFHSSEWIIQL